MATPQLTKQTQLKQCPPFVFTSMGAPKAHSSSLLVYRAEEIKVVNYQLFWGKKYKRVIILNSFSRNELPGLLEVYFVDLNLTQFVLFPQDSQVQVFLFVFPPKILNNQTLGVFPRNTSSCFISFSGAEVTKVSQQFMQYYLQLEKKIQKIQLRNFYL